MRRLAGCGGASMLVHVLALGWVASRTAAWRRAVTREPPPPAEAILVEPQPAPIGPAAPVSGAAPARPARARAHAHAAPRAEPMEPVSTDPGAETATGQVANPGLVGGGGEPSVGVATGPGVPGGGPNLDALAAAIAEQVQAHSDYPFLARQQGVEGVVEVALTIGRDGVVQDLHIVKSAGSLLDRAAERAVRAAQPLPPCNVAVRIPIRFRLQRERAIR
jgi:protein TonB